MKERQKDELLELKSKLIALTYDTEAARLQLDAESKLINIVSRVNYEKTKLQYQQLIKQINIERERLSNLSSKHKAEIFAQESHIALRRRQLSLAESNKSSLQVKSGINGIVQEIRVKPGQSISLGEVIATVARKDSLKAEIRVAENQAKSVILGQKVLLKYGKEDLSGRVKRIDPIVKEGTVTIDVELDNDSPPGGRPNLRVSATLEIERLKDVVYVGRPIQGYSNGAAVLYKLGENNKAIKTRVEFGKESISEVEVLSGLKPGDQVILSDMSKLNGIEKFTLK